MFKAVMQQPFLIHFFFLFFRTLSKMIQDAYDFAQKHLVGKEENGPHTDLSQPEHDCIKCIAWHPHRKVLAMAHKDDLVYIYELDSLGKSWTCKVLQHRYMRGISCIEWKQRTNGTLAVGCRYDVTSCLYCMRLFNLSSGWSRLGVCVWNIGTETIEHNQEDPAVPHYSTVASMNYLCYPGHKDISSVAWDPSPASHLLAVCSQTSGLLVIYDTLLLSSMPLKREGNGNRIVCWSPNGEWLYCASR